MNLKSKFVQIDRYVRYVCAHTCVCALVHMCMHLCMNAYLCVFVFVYCIYSLSKVKTHQKALDYLTKNPVLT